MYNGYDDGPRGPWMRTLGTLNIPHAPWPQRFNWTMRAWELRIPSPITRWRLSLAFSSCFRCAIRPWIGLDWSSCPQTNRIKMIAITPTQLRLRFCYTAQSYLPQLLTYYLQTQLPKTQHRHHPSSVGIKVSLTFNFHYQTFLRHLFHSGVAVESDIDYQEIFPRWCML